MVSAVFAYNLWKEKKSLILLYFNRKIIYDVLKDWINEYYINTLQIILLLLHSKQDTRERKTETSVQNRVGTIERYL